jgi:hypothetical protein
MDSWMIVKHQKILISNIIKRLYLDRGDWNMGRILGFFRDRVLRTVCGGFEDPLNVVAGILIFCI